MEKETIVKKPVLGNMARHFAALFLLCFVAATVVFAVLAVKLPDLRKVMLILLAGCDVIFLLLAYVVPVCACFGHYSYSLSPESITLWRRDEAVMTMKWAETEVSLGSFISKGSEKNPTVCAKAICFTRSGCMRHPQRFPKRALKGAAGELCIAFSKNRLREVYQACGGNICDDVTADGCRLSVPDTQAMTLSLQKLREKEAKAAAKAAKEEEL